MFRPSLLIVLVTLSLCRDIPPVHLACADAPRGERAQHVAIAPAALTLAGSADRTVPLRLERPAFTATMLWMSVGGAVLLILTIIAVLFP